MEQTNLSLGEIKKLRREMRSMNQSLDHLKNDMEGIHQTLSNGLQKIFSEIEKLKLDNHKIKSNLKYVMKMKTNISWESSFYSDSDVRCNPLMHGSRESLGYFKGTLPDHKGRNYTSDDTDDDRDTLVSDIVEDGTRKCRKEKRKKFQNQLNPRPFSDQQISSSDSENTLPSHKQRLPHQQSEISSSPRQNCFETDQITFSVQDILPYNTPLQTMKKELRPVSGSTSSLTTTSTDTSSGTSGTISTVFSGTSKSENGASSTDINISSGAAGSYEEVSDNGYDSDEPDTNIEMEVRTKCQVLYPHLIEGYEPVMVPCDQIKFNDHKQYLRSLGFVLIDQTLKEFMYRMAMVDNKKNEQLPKGLYTVLLLDTSYSIGPGGMYEVRKFVHDFLDEVETATEHNLEEMICLFELGSCNGVLHEFTNDYSLLRESLDKIDKCGGRTNLWSSLIGLYCYLHKKSKKCVINEKTHGVRIVWVSDGNVTDDMHVLSNSENEADLERIQDRILKFMPYLLREKMILSAVEVGMDSEPEFLERFIKKGKGQIGKALWGKHVGRYYLYQHIIGKMLGDLRDPQNRGKIKEVIQKHTTDFDYFDKTDIAEISLLLRDRYKFTVPEELFEREPLPEYDDDHRVELYTKELFPRIPPIGTRVKPGDKFKDRHKQYYKGTVVAHCRRNTVVVKWDEEVPQPKIYFYKYEIENHEVEIIYEYRKINISIPGDIGTGCRVRRGVHWERGDEDGGRNKVGIVVRKHAGKMVTVKWPSGKSARYRFGADDCYDLEVIAETEIIEYTDEKDKEKKLKAREKVLQWEFEDREGLWRTLDEEGNNAVINFLDMQNGERGKAETIFDGAGYYFYLDRMEYELKNDTTVKGKIRVEEITAEEQEKRRDNEWERYKQRKRANRMRQGGQGGLFMGQMGQEGGIHGLSGQAGQGGIEELAGVLGPDQQEQLNALLSQPGAKEQLASLLQGQGQEMAGMFGQGGGNSVSSMMMGRGQGMGGMGQMFGGQGMPGQAGVMRQGGFGRGGMMGQDMPGGAGMMDLSGGPKWYCSVCTLENDPQLYNCSACGNNRD